MAAINVITYVSVAIMQTAKIKVKDFKNLIDISGTMVQSNICSGCTSSPYFGIHKVKYEKQLFPKVVRQSISPSTRKKPS